MPERFRIIGAARQADRATRSSASWRASRSQARAASARRRGLGAVRSSRCASPASATVSTRSATAVDAAREELGGDAGLLFYLSLPPQAAAGTVEEIGALGLGHGARVITEKPFGTDLDSARELNAQLHSVFAEELHLPDRPLPRPRGGAEPAGAALRQRDVRAGLEPQPHRPRPDRHPGDALDRDARQLLRGNGRLPRHGRHPPVPGARLRRDGAADLAGAETARDRAREGLRVDAAAAARGRGPRPVRAATAKRTASPPTPTPRPSSRSRPSSTTGAGRGCRSTCARASGWRRASTC